MKKPIFKGYSFKKSLKTRAVRAGGYSAAAIAVVLAIVIVVNLLVAQLPDSALKVDTTNTKIFTLSDQTKEIVSGLTEDVTVYWVTQSSNANADLEKLLDRYESLSGHLTVVRKDPVASPAFVKTYTSDDLAENSLIVVCGTRSKVLSYNDIVSVDYSSYYTTGSYSATFDGESLLTSAISYVTSSNLPKVYTLEGHGETTLSSTVKSSITGENMEVDSLNLLSAGSVPDDCGCLLIFSPQSDISEEEAATLSDYVNNGGSLFLISDYVKGGLPNLEGVMAAWGVTVSDGIVIEGNQSYCASGYPHYLLPTLQAQAITEPLISGNYKVLMPVAQGLTIAGTLPDGEVATSLLQTSSDAYSKVAAYDMTTYAKEDGDIAGPFSLGVAITVNSESETSGKAVWLTTSNFLDSNADKMVSGANTDLFLNSLGWLADQESTISIHAKTLENSYLTVSNAASAQLSVLLIGVIPLAVLVLGVVTVVRRRRK